MFVVPLRLSHLGHFICLFLSMMHLEMSLYAKIQKQRVLIFQFFHATIERETSRLLNHLETDGRGEYMSKLSEGYCANHRIKQEKLVSNTPENNGVIERIML